ncbi:hypothetical protein AAW00_13225 [Aurantiacibacter luteus]|uniref:Protein CR006 P-loop domain-containing protein n=2 Tax=Aurantiacibacter luteus TaxID=1581420 RepID=A0A0G9MPF8_9SPHN|nr:hypothetical protein AAW00_13225 [Aurantiacibacter luteus]
MIERFQLLRNVGQFNSVSEGAHLPLTRLNLIYAENGRGKTTLATILKSLSTGDSAAVMERRRLGSNNPPHIIIALAGQSDAIFQNGSWSFTEPDVVVFDDAFVAANVCSGMAIETAHKQNLHELILGAQGVLLNAALQKHVVAVEEHNRALRQKSDAIPAGARGPLTVDRFCGLALDPDIDAKLETARRNLAAAKSADAVRSRAEFLALSLPAFDMDAIDTLLARTLPDLEADAAARVRDHLRRLGKGGEAWVGEGMGRVASVSADRTGEVCPFCAQDLAGSLLIGHYQAYFSEAYNALKRAITHVGQGINTTHGGDAPAAFERSVRVASENREFWKTFTDIPAVEVDTAAIARDWSAAREAVLTVLRAKAAAPLEAMSLSTEARTAIDRHHEHREAISMLSNTLLARNDAIGVVREKASGANVATLSSDLEKLTAVKARHETATAVLCDDYLSEKASKAKTEKQRTAARAALDQYRKDIFPAYETAINDYLARFNAGFRLGSVTSVNNRGGSSATYNVLINNVEVALTGDGGPSFKNTLSAGDRNTLALAFFFASLNQDARLANKLVVIDDPMTSLDEHRRLTTIQEMQRLYDRVSQMVVLSHSKPFLCSIWESADKATRSAMRIARDGRGSKLATWDIRQDSVTQHDRRHQLVRHYIRTGDDANEREVAAALRPILEAFMRVAHPERFPPGSLLGPFIDVCRQRHGRADEVLSPGDTAELRALLDYANRFHHDSNPAWETAVVNDQELLDFATRTLNFAR